MIAGSRGATFVGGLVALLGAVALAPSALAQSAPAQGALAPSVLAAEDDAPRAAPRYDVVVEGRVIGGWLVGPSRFSQTRRVLAEPREADVWRDEPGRTSLLPGATLLADRAVGEGDASIHARLFVAGAERGASALLLGDGVFGWDGAEGRPFVEGGPFGGLVLLSAPGGAALRERWFEVDVVRRGELLVLSVDGVALHAARVSGPLGSLTLRAQRSELRVGELWMAGELAQVRGPLAERRSLPTFDATLSGSIDVSRASVSPADPTPHDGVARTAFGAGLRLEITSEPRTPGVLGDRRLTQSVLEVDDVGQVVEVDGSVEIARPGPLAAAMPGHVALSRSVAPGIGWHPGEERLVGFVTDDSRRTNGLLLRWVGWDEGGEPMPRWDVSELPASLAGSGHVVVGANWANPCCSQLFVAFVNELRGSPTWGDLILAVADFDDLASHGDAILRVRLLDDPQPAEGGLALRIRRDERVDGCRLVSVTASLAGAPGCPSEDVTFTLDPSELLARADDFDARLPLIDLAHDDARRVVVDREAGQYLGHPTTVMLPDGRTLYCVYPQGHGRGALAMKRSDDGGLTWSERLPLPASFATSQEVPTIHRLVDREGTARLVLFSGLFPIRRALSLDEGRTWSELEPLGPWGGIVAMASLTALRDGRHMAFFHDDGRFLTGSGRTGAFTVYSLVSDDGGVSWSGLQVVARHPDAQLCEPGLVRSPDGSRLALLLRENSRAYHAFVVFSDDEVETWTTPRELPASLTGDRHVAAYAPDGRLLIAFRDTLPESPTWGDWVAWVGTFDDLVRGAKGQYRVRLGDNLVDADCAYPGVEVLPDGTFVLTTYGHWLEHEPPYVVSVRVTLDELDARLAAQAGR